LSVEGCGELKHINNIQQKKQKKEDSIYLDYKNRQIMIPKEMVEEFVIKFY